MTGSRLFTGIAILSSGTYYWASWGGDGAARAAGLILVGRRAGWAGLRGDAGGAAAGSADGAGRAGSAFMMLTGGIEAAEGKKTFGPGGRLVLGDACAGGAAAGTAGASAATGAAAEGQAAA